ncbi:hypothetical protein GQX74_008864 [Glossina fuscipes]|nr:hypothetical protein GQX74_008864 [Glossina fuscipes]
MKGPPTRSNFVHSLIYHFHIVIAYVLLLSHELDSRWRSSAENQSRPGQDRSVMHPLTANRNAATFTKITPSGRKPFQPVTRRDCKENLTISPEFAKSSICEVLARVYVRAVKNEP